ncbi:penicillin-binding protein 2 [Modestobacter sp. I12A-02628]|uniref:Penicillin-binding protein 2 n=1 Tax=Goekera deserti TaxID=2497753 RepID=A0A7K3WAS6_9ACTN|nr:penicillin-binding protein 2 [Goekera deserti]NDI47615.1 penicillin-binding protein 2 [Goekera deserti]NDI47678.1 penicillin-binding protein 2 [Goekera deserti]NEL53426.1 penicillin-binding protein 2 [Goekera deserti]
MPPARAGAPAPGRGANAPSARGSSTTPGRGASAAPGRGGAFAPRREPGSRRVEGRLGTAGRSRSHRWGAVLLVLLLGAIAVRLVVLQGIDGSAYAAQATDERMRSYPVDAVRGKILDSAGNVLAYSVDAERVVANPRQISDPQATAQALTGLLGVPVETLVEKLSRDSGYVVLARRVALDVTDQIRALDPALAGISYADDPVRLYPAGAVGGQVVGFVGSEGTGLAGIESEYQDVLAGTPGEERVEVGANGNVIPSGIDDSTPAVDGGTVTLTLDEDVQYIVQQRLDQACADGDTTSGSAVVLDVQTGEVVAMASCPGYDPGSYNTTDPDLLGNPVVSDVFEPGSVMKAVTMAAAVEEGIATPDTVLSVNGHIQAGDKVVTDAHDHAPVDWTVTGILAKSSNVGTIMLAREVGDAKLEAYMRAFGLGSRTGVELPGESAGILEPSADWTASRAANVPIGQGVSVTALQMASVYQAIANGGVRIPPRVVESVTAADGTVTRPPAPEPTRVVSETSARAVAYMLEAVVGKGGTAPLGEVPGYRVAGKTGTAQRANPDCSCYSGGGYFTTFVGFAPADAPRYVVAVDLERPNSDAEGGQVAAPVFADVMRQVLTLDRVAPTGTARPDFTLVAP